MSNKRLLILAMILSTGVGFVAQAAGDGPLWLAACGGFCIGLYVALSARWT